jgi:hypothetical protein
LQTPAIEQRGVRGSGPGGHFVQSLPNAFQTLGEHFRFAADAYAKMVRHFEESSGDNACVIFLSQELAEGIDATRDNVGK